MHLVRLAQGDVELLLAPDVGGSIAAFRWRNHDMLRPAVQDADVLGMASFPLVPFSNRIAFGRFVADGQMVALPPNLPRVDQLHAIHGFGWLAAWDVTEQKPAAARLVHRHTAAAWPWDYTAEQYFALDQSGFTQRLILRNDGRRPMPAGLGCHPYFARGGATLELGVAGRWDSDAHLLPSHWQALTTQPDWLGSAAMDDVFTGRSGPIAIQWPGRRLLITPSDDLSFTVVYAPPGADYFCVEPVSHMTDAVNRAEAPEVTGLRWLAPGETWEAHVHFAVTAA